jgi:hypothetical protein
MDGNVSGRPVRPHFRRGWLALGLACAALLLLTGCGGGGKNKAGGTSTGQVTVQQLDKFAACMRHNGVPSFYFAPYGSTPTSDSELSLRGYLVPGVRPNTPNFATAIKACHSVDPLGQPGKVTRQQFDSQLRFAECMRAHGFPTYPDPTEQDGRLTEQPLPSSIDQSSPQFQKAENTCGS